MTAKQLKSLTNRINTLKAELASEYTKSLGPAAAKCVQEALTQAEKQLEDAK